MLLIVEPIWGKYYIPQDAYKSQSWTTCAHSPPPRLSSVILSPPKPPSKEDPRIKRGRISSMHYDSADNFKKLMLIIPIPRHSSLYWQCCPWTAPTMRIIVRKKITFLFTLYFSFLWHLYLSFFNVQSTDHWRRLIHYYPNNWTTKSKLLLPDARYRPAS